MHMLNVSPRISIAVLGLVCAAVTAVGDLQAGTRTYDVLSFEAVGDGETKDTAAVQRAIDACAGAGGGTVYFAPGTYLCGSLHLRSNITLHLDNGATILASTDDADFDPFEKLDFENDSDEETSYFHFSLIWGEDLENVAIEGRGTIDSNRRDRSGPKTIGLKRCKQVTIRDITIRNAGNYAISMLGTDFVNIDAVSIFSSYCDGIDPDSCQNVRISNCYIESWDDAICPKASFALGYRRAAKNITVTNCIMATNCNGFKLGTESAGDFTHITVSNCVVTTYKSKVDYREPATPISGITLISADGAHISDVTISNIAMDEVRFPIFLRLANRGRDMEEPVPGTMKNVTISNITASDALIGGIIIGEPERPIENVHLDKVRITCKGGGAKEEPGIDVPAMMLKYPSAYKFHELPTYGFYVRHASGVTLDRVRLSLNTPDTRHALICEDAADIAIDGLRVQPVEDAAPTILFREIRDALIQGCAPPAGSTAFLRVTGEASARITLLNNDFSRVKGAILVEEGAKDNCVQIGSGL
ncbi:MAG: right-handed parallel beta-helix repeat-containing protein [Candidatus Hydrogenedentes bacterium]|nr:right-handed parallel beta-helix repeat-containing protein [Candidatus Hydrogenedentota bacterium]